MSFSRSYNSFLVEPAADFHHPRPLLLSARGIPSRDVAEESVSSHEPNSVHDSPENEAADASPTPLQADQPHVHATTTSQATQMTPRTARPVASRDTASSPRTWHTRELETQTEPHMTTIQENGDLGGRSTSSGMSTSPLGQLSDKSQTFVSSVWDSSTIGVQTNGQPDMKDSAVSARSLVVGSSHATAGTSDHAETQTASARRQDFGVSARRMENGESGTQTLSRQLSEIGEQYWIVPWSLVCISIWQFVSLSACLYVCPIVCLSVCQVVKRFVCLFVCFSIRLYVYWSGGLSGSVSFYRFISVCLSVCLCGGLLLRLRRSLRLLIFPSA